MFARFRNIFSKSKSDAITAEENDVIRGNDEAKSQSQPENTELGDNITKEENGNITRKNTNDKKELQESTKDAVDVPEEKANSDIEAEVGNNSMQLLQENGNITGGYSKVDKESSEEVTKTALDTPEQTATSNSAAEVDKNTMHRLQELVKYGNITTERSKDAEETKECGIPAKSSEDTVGIFKDTTATPMKASEKIIENNISDKAKDAEVVSEKTLENNKSVEVVKDDEALLQDLTRTEKIEVSTVPSKDTEKLVTIETTKSALALDHGEAGSPTAENTPSATDQPKAAAEHADESERSEGVVSGDSAQPETEIGAAANGADAFGVENAVRVGNEVSRETTEATDLTAEVTTLVGKNAAEESENRNAPNTSSMPAAPAAGTHLKNSNENALNNSSVVVDDLVTDVSSPVSVGTQLSAEVDATADGQTESGTIVVNPTGDNEIACTAISNKLKEISEVAESLDATIRDVQNDTEVLETTSTAAEKKRENMRSNSSEDWHSRSTEDESFATASEGNFTPHSYSSSFQTASGRTSSYISSGKNSFDASEADDEAAATSSINMSFDSSEHSFLSAQQPTPSSVSPLQQHGVGVDNHDDDDDVLKAHVNANVSAQGDGASMADAEASRSQSVTPTPDATHYRSIPFDSETELESSYIAESPPMEVLRQPSPMTSVTPEVSTCTQHTPPAPPQGTNSHSSDGGQKPNAAWRRSKYYENITKQTIKGFL